MKLQNVQEVVQVSSSFWKCCKYCSALKMSEDSVEEQVNHYLRHGLKFHRCPHIRQVRGHLPGAKACCFAPVNLRISFCYWGSRTGV